MNWGMSLIFFYVFRHTYKYILMIQSIDMSAQVHLGVPKIIPNSKFHYVKAELSYDAIVYG